MGYKLKPKQALVNSRGKVSDTAFGIMATLHSAGMGIKTIARAVNVYPGTVRKQIKNGIDAGGKYVAPTNRSNNRAPPPVTAEMQQNQQHRRQLVEALVTKVVVKKRAKRTRAKRQPNAREAHRHFPHGSPALIKRALATKHKINVSESTVRRDLQALGRKAKVRAKKSYQYEEDPDIRHRFASRLLRSTKTAEWRNFVFSDEKFFDTDDHSNRYQWCTADQKPHPRGRQQKPPSVHVWGAIGVDFKHLIVHSKEVPKNVKRPPQGRPPKNETAAQKKVREDFRKAKKAAATVTSTKYINRCLVPILPKLQKPDTVFMQDGAPIHTASPTMTFLRKKKVRMLEQWPARSADLNPIENLWALVQKKVSDRGPQDAEELEAFVKAEWAKVSQATINKYVLSFRSRVQRVKGAQGAALRQ